MIYELTTYDLKPRSLSLVEARLGEVYLENGRPPELIGSFHTEFGPLNQIVQIRRYAGIEHCQSVAARHAMPTGIGEHVLTVTNQLMTPTAISPELKPGQLGPYFELRTYTFPLGTLDKLIESWGRAMPMRDQLGSPVAAIWTSMIGGLNSLTHIWPYKSLEEREHIRLKVRESGLWPPYKLDVAEGGMGYEILSQCNKLMLPAVFSPLQ